MNPEVMTTLYTATRRTKNAIRSFATVIALCCMFGTGCASEENGIRLFVASSMTDFIQQIAASHMTAHPGSGLEINIAGSGTLLSQLEEGAGADVVILAGSDYMLRLQNFGSFLPPVQVASTSLSVVVSPELVAADISMQDLRVGRLQGAACVISAPCGQLAEEFAAATGLDLNSFTREANVRSVLAKVERGEVDFGLVYRTDFLSSEAQIGEISNSGAEMFVTFYSLAVARDTPDMPQAASLLDLITAPSGQEQLRQLGFEVP